VGLGLKNSNARSELVAALKRSCLPLPWCFGQLAQHDRESNAKLVFPCLMKLNNPESQLEQNSPFIDWPSKPYYV
jgi:hypothetical protein